MEGQDLISHEITKNITLISPKRLNINLEDKKTLKLSEGIDSPLAIIIPWLFAKKSHLLKYSKIYTDQGFNVLTVQITPWELLWPAKGAKLVAQDALNFLENNTQFSPLIVHGFSVAGYLWGEILLLIINDLSRYQPLLDKFYAQIWDSITGVPEIPIGVPPSVFPNNKILQNGFRNYIIFHLKIFHDVATVHYIKSQDLFHNTVLKVPALFLVSKSDLIGSYATNISTKEDMDLNGIKTTWKCWEKSPHVGHFMKHPEEYLSYVHKHLKDSNVLEKIAEKIKSKL